MVAEHEGFDTGDADITTLGPEFREGAGARATLDGPGFVIEHEDLDRTKVSSPTGVSIFGGSRVGEEQISDSKDNSGR